MFKLFKKNNPIKTTSKEPKDLSQQLEKTKKKFGHRLKNLLLTQHIDENLLQELEYTLIEADIGLKTTDKIIANIKKNHKKIKDKDALYQTTKQQLNDLLIEAKPLSLDNKKPFVILIVGVNGAGKTTTIGKLAKQFQQQNKSVLLAAGDTFRAGAISQLKIWGEKNSIDVVSQQEGSDSASVIYDALDKATAKNIDILIADTAGRLHTQTNLMNELKKIKQTLHKYRSDTPNEIMLILDGNIGTNSINQAKTFHTYLTIDSISITKLDGTAKGGVLFSICDELHLPIRYIGTGEQIDDLKPFNKNNYINAIL